LLEPHDELIAPPAVPGLAGSAQCERGHRGQGRAQPLGQLPAGLRHGAGHDGGRGGRRRLPGHHVRPVHGDRREQFGHHRAQVAGGQPAQRGVVAPGQQPGQAAHLRPQAAPGDLPFGGLGHRREARCSAGEPHVLGGERRGPGRVKEKPAGPAERVVPGGARAPPVGRQLLGPGEDLLAGHPGAAGRLGQPVQVAARVGEPVGVVHPQAVDQPFGHQAQQQAVGRGEHVLVLHPDRDEGGDVEEPPPVQFGGGGPPAGQPVVLGGGQVGQRQVLGARADRQHVLVIEEHGPVRAAVVHRQVADAVVERPGQDRQ
jgi:hypothetical protein